MKPEYYINIGLDTTTKLYGCVVSSKQPICGRYDFTTEEAARLWGEKQIEQSESIRLDPTDMKKFSQFAERISQKSKAILK